MIEAMIWGLMCGRNNEVFKYFNKKAPPGTHLTNELTIHEANTLIENVLKINKLPLTINRIERDIDKNLIPVYKCDYCKLVFVKSWGSVREGYGCNMCLTYRYNKTVSIPESTVFNILFNQNMFACIDGTTGGIDKNRMHIDYNSGRHGPDGGSSREDLHIDKGIVRLGTIQPILCKLVNSLVVEVDGKQHVNSTTDYIHHEHAYGRDDLLRLWGELRYTLYPPCIFLTLLCALCDYDCAMTRFCYLGAFDGTPTERTAWLVRYKEFFGKKNDANLGGKGHNEYLLPYFMKMS